MKKLLFIAVMLSLLFATGTQAVFADDVQVERIAFPVVLSDNQQYQVVGYLYTQAGNPNNIDQCGARNHTVQVLLHGATYNHRYWDAAAINGNDYSYARYMAQQCYAVLALDRLGSGESSKPDGDLVNLANDSDSIAQVLSSLRTNRNPSQRRFKRIVLVGHSFGSLDAVYTLGEYGNVADALVATGWIHSPGTVPIEPAIFEALLANPYISVPAELRTALFYHAPAADPDVIAYDNATLSDTLTRGYLADALGVFTARAYADINQITALTKVDHVNVPVFVQLSDFDILFPSALAGAEAGFYGNAPSVTVDNLANIGHGFNLHTEHLAGWQHIAGWIAGMFDHLED